MLPYSYSIMICVCVCVFFNIVKCFLPLKVNVKYSILNIQFGYKKYLSSY